MRQRVLRLIRGTTVILSAVTVLALILSFSQPYSVNAATSCSGATHLFDGTDPQSITHYGSKADINTRVPALCGASWSDSSIWAMMASGPGGCGYAQAGYIRHTGESTSSYFAEYLKDCSSSAGYKQTSAASGTHTYSNVYNFSTGHISMNMDSTTLLTTNFDPAVSWSPGWMPEWEGEVHDNGDDMAGSSSSPAYFSNIQIIPCRSCGWTTPSGLTISSDSSRYGYAWNSNTQFHIWTK